MNYTLHQLRVFHKVVENESVTKAAEQLNMTQPAVSIQLKNLQKQFDVPLTEIIGRQLHITEFGQEIYKVAVRILEEIEFIDYKTKAFKGLLVGKLRIASVSTGKYVMPYFLSDFLSEHPEVSISLDVTNKRDVITSLEENEVDFALVSIPPEHLKLKKLHLMTNQLNMVGRSDLPDWEPGKKKGQLPIIFREGGSGTRFLMQQYFDELDFSPRIGLQLKSNEAVKQAVLAGLGYSILSVVSLRNELGNGSLKIMKSPKLPVYSEWQLVWQERKRLSPVAEAFLQHLQANKEAITQQQFSWLKKYMDA